VSALTAAESNTTTAERWVDLIDAAQRRKNTTVVWPSAGPHPTVPSREAMQ